MRIIDIGNKGESFHIMLVLDSGENAVVVMRKPTTLGLVSVTPLRTYDEADRSATTEIMTKAIKTYGSESLISALKSGDVEGLKLLLQKAIDGEPSHK